MFLAAFYFSIILSLIVSILLILVTVLTRLLGLLRLLSTRITSNQGSRVISVRLSYILVKNYSNILVES